MLKVSQPKEVVEQLEIGTQNGEYSVMKVLGLPRRTTTTELKNKRIEITSFTELDDTRFSSGKKYIRIVASYEHDGVKELYSFNTSAKDILKKLTKAKSQLPIWATIREGKTVKGQNYFYLE